MSPTCFKPHGFICKKTGCICSIVSFTCIGVSSLVGKLNTLSYSPELTPMHVKIPYCIQNLSSLG